MDKSELRFLGKKVLQGMSRKERQRIERAIYQHLFHSSLWKRANVIGVTLSQSHEWSTAPIIESGWDNNKKIAAPKCDPKSKQMQFYQLESYDQLEKVYFDLREPKPDHTMAVSKQDIDLLLVPGLLFDEKGYRIGYGGGFYDRYIEGFQGETMMIASQKQKRASLPIEDFDQRVEYVLTEEGIRSTFTY